jgi:signal transduction histidine kinase
MESIGSLAGGIAHDLNNILSPISGLSEMLLDDMPPGTPEHESVEQIHKSAQRDSDLVKQILAFSGIRHRQRSWRGYSGLKRIWERNNVQSVFAHPDRHQGRDDRHCHQRVADRP